MRRLNRNGVLCFLSLSVGCATPAPPPDDTGQRDANASTAATMVGREWSLVALGERSSPTGAGGKRLTMQFDSARVAGFAGCNRYSGPYTITRDSLKFGPIMSTKMACLGVDNIEQEYLSALSKVVTYAITDTLLTLNGAGGTLARFTSPPR